MATLTVLGPLNRKLGSANNTCFWGKRVLCPCCVSSSPPSSSKIRLSGEVTKLVGLRKLEGEGKIKLK